MTVSSSYLASDAISMNSLNVRVQCELDINIIMLSKHYYSFIILYKVPTPSSITLTSIGRSSNSLLVLGSNITLTCTLELNSAIVVSEIFSLMVDVQLSRDGTPLTLTGPTVTGTTFTYTTQLNSTGRSESGNYTCNATVRPQPTLTYLTGSETLSDTVNIKAGIL